MVFLKYTCHEQKLGLGKSVDCPEQTSDPNSVQQICGLSECSPTLN